MSAIFYETAKNDLLSDIAHFEVEHNPYLSNTTGRAGQWRSRGGNTDQVKAPGRRFKKKGNGRARLGQGAIDP